MSGKQPSWPDGMDAADRVRHVALTRTSPHNAGWIATEADVSRDTAVKHLSKLVDRGTLTTVETAEGTCYEPDAITQFLDEVRDLADRFSNDELTAELRDIGTEIDGWKREFDVDSLTELRRAVGSDDLASEERRERLETVEQWAYDIETREAIRLAISLNDTLRGLGMNGGPETRVGSLLQEG
jgi:hypothetical protein